MNVPALAVSAAALAAVVLGLIDYAHYGPEYMTPRPWLLCILLGAAGALLASKVLDRGEIPQLERHAISVFAGLGVGILCYSALLRLDAALSEGYQEITFELHPDRVLRAADPAVPAIPAPIDRPFWLEQPSGSTWSIRVAHGPLGVWQYDQGPIAETIREHYMRSP